MNISVHNDPGEANQSAAELLAEWLLDPAVKTFMPAAGNTPLELYDLIARKRRDLQHLTVFILDEYAGVPLEEPRSCSNLLKQAVGEAWEIPDHQFHTISSVEPQAGNSVLEHERKIQAAGGLDVVVLGLGQNGHLGFNEPGSEENSTARVINLEPVSIEANRAWFNGRYAPSKGATIGLKTILAARRIMVLAFGPHKAKAVSAMTNGPRGAACPASFLQGRPDVHLFLDQAAAENLFGR